MLGGKSAVIVTATTTVPVLYRLRNISGTAILPIAAEKATDDPVTAATRHSQRLIQSRSRTASSNPGLRGIDQSLRQSRMVTNEPHEQLRRDRDQDPAACESVEQNPKRPPGVVPVGHRPERDTNTETHHHQQDKGNNEDTCGLKIRLFSAVHQIGISDLDSSTPAVPAQ